MPWKVASRLVAARLSSINAERNGSVCRGVVDDMTVVRLCVNGEVRGLAVSWLLTVVKLRLSSTV